MNHKIIVSALLLGIYTSTAMADVMAHCNYDGIQSEKYVYKCQNPISASPNDAFAMVTKKKLADRVDIRSDEGIECKYSETLKMGMFDDRKVRIYKCKGKKDDMEVGISIRSKKKVFRVYELSEKEVQAERQRSKDLQKQFDADADRNMEEYEARKRARDEQERKEQEEMINSIFGGN